MRLFISCFLILVSYSSFAQHEYMLWTEIGVEKKLSKRYKLSGELNTRLGENGVETFFPQLGIEYKIKKWIKPSLEYRFLVDKNKYGNYKASHRINANLNLKNSVKRLSYSLRIRYQYGFNRISQASYDADFDQAFRFKPAFEFDVKNSIVNPILSAELFFNPTYGPKSPGFNKARYAIGLKLDKKGPHNVQVKYQVDHKFIDYSADLRHVLSLSYGYAF